MPELPEVETIARQLAAAIAGRRILALEILDPRLGRLPAWARPAGARVRRVFRLGKQVVLELDRQLWLAVHLRMTGRLIWSEGRRRVSTQHLRARLRLTGGSLLLYDPRRFGTLTVCRDLDEIRPRGEDPLAESFSAARLAGLLRGSRQPLKLWLLRQDRLVGIGNIYASEILFQAGLDPRRPTSSLGRREVERLHRATRAVLRRAIEHSGTTFSDYRDAQGQTGSYQSCLAVYGREGEPCRKCGGVVQRLLQQQRSTFFCRGCQR